jgi:hypothetical protein
VVVPGPDEPRNQELADALRAEADREGAGRPGVYRALLGGVVLVPTTQASPEAESTVAVFPFTGGGGVLVTFSAVGALRSWSAQARTFVAMPGRDLAALARRHRVDGVILDPGSPSALSLAPAELDALADGLLPVPPGQGPFTVASPLPRAVRPTRLTYPDAARASLRRLSSRPEVAAVHLLDVNYGDGEPVPTVAVELAPVVRDPGGLLEETASSLASSLPPGQRVDVVEADDALLDAVARLAADGEDTAPR